MGIFFTIVGHHSELWNLCREMLSDSGGSGNRSLTLVSRHLNILKVGSFIALLLVILPLATWHSSGPNWITIAVGIAGVFFVGGDWLRIARLRPILEIKTTISLRDGEVMFLAPAVPYDLWIFCEAPFAAYCGTISLSRVGSTDIHTIEVRRWSVMSPAARVDYRPIICRVYRTQSAFQGECRLQFRLSPIFPRSSLGFETHELEMVTLIVSKRSSKIGR